MITFIYSSLRQLVMSNLVPLQKCLVNTVWPDRVLMVTMMGALLSTQSSWISILQGRGGGEEGEAQTLTQLNWLAALNLAWLKSFTEYTRGWTIVFELLLGTLMNISFQLPLRMALISMALKGPRENTWRLESVIIVLRMGWASAGDAAVCSWLQRLFVNELKLTVRMRREPQVTESMQTGGLGALHHLGLLALNQLRVS